MLNNLPSTNYGNNYVFVVIDRFSKMAIITAYKKSITAEATAKLFFERVWVHFGIHNLSSHIGTTSSSVYFGLVSSRCWTPSSLITHLSIPKFMARPRLSTKWLYKFYTGTTQSIHVHGMRFYPMCNISTITLSIAWLATTLFRWAWDSSHYVRLMWPYHL